MLKIAFSILFLISFGIKEMNSEYYLHNNLFKKIDSSIACLFNSMNAKKIWKLEALLKNTYIFMSCLNTKLINEVFGF